MTNRIRPASTPQTAATLVRRDIDVLSKVAPQVANVLVRADGIVANKPRDGFITPEELATSLQSPAVDVLSSGERQQLTAATRLLDWEAPKANPFPQLPTFSISTQTTKVDPKRWPAAVPDINTPFGISPYATKVDAFNNSIRVDMFVRPWIVEIAQRVQRVANPDGDPKTISVADIRSALQTHGTSFTPTELGYLKELEGALLSAAQRLDTRPSAVTPNVGWHLDVTSPQSFKLPLTTGPVELAVSGTVNEDSRTYTSVAFTRRNEFVLNVPAGYQAIVSPAELHDNTSKDPRTAMYRVPTKDEMLFDAGQHAKLVLQPGDYLVEAWKDGQRVQSENVHVDTLPGESEGTVYADGSPATHYTTQSIEARVEPGGTFTIHGARISQSSTGYPPGIFETRVKLVGQELLPAPYGEGRTLTVTTRGDDGPASVRLGNGREAIFGVVPKTGQLHASVPLKVGSSEIYIGLTLTKAGGIEAQMEVPDGYKPAPVRELTLEQVGS